MFITNEDVIVTEVLLVTYVVAKSGAVVHKNRPSHGFVLNDSEGQRDYYFSYGTILHTCENDFFYLPEGSSYEVKEIKNGGCYAINFNANICAEPFLINFKNNERILKIFRDAEKEWLSKSFFYKTSIRKAICEIILMIAKEQQRNYLPGKKEQIIMPALEKIKTEFTNNVLSIPELARMCNISEVYFRKLFTDKFGISPKEYIIKKRINHAKDLLKSGMFSVSEVAMLCGYTEQCHFSREFKKRTGENPNSYK